MSKDQSQELTQDPRNLNKGTVRGRGLLEKSLGRLGAGRSVLVDKNGVLIAGNKTAEMAAELGIPIQIIESDGKTLYAIKRTDLDMAEGNEALELALADNRVAEVSLSWDTDELASMMADGLDADEYFFKEEIEDLFAQSELDRDEVEMPPSIIEGTDLDMEIAPPALPVSTLGDVWLLGRHRLINADSTDQSAIEKLVDGEKMDMVWTDPPYGVAIGDKNKYLDSVGHGGSHRITENLKNDDVDAIALEIMVREAFTTAVTVCRPGAVWQVASPAIDLFLVFGTVLKNLKIWHQTIIWVKNTATFSPMGVDYHWKHESLFHGWVPGAAHNQPKTRTETTVWEIDRPMSSPDHPTMKPVVLVEKGLENHTNLDDRVLDMFGGSGTTLIACEVKGRVAYLSELDPKYCDVILMRYKNATGDDPVLESTGETFSSLQEQRP